MYEILLLGCKQTCQIMAAPCLDFDGGWFDHWLSGYELLNALALPVKVMATNHCQSMDINTFE